MAPFSDLRVRRRIGVRRRAARRDDARAARRRRHPLRHHRRRPRLPTAGRSPATASASTGTGSTRASARSPSTCAARGPRARHRADHRAGRRTPASSSPTSRRAAGSPTSACARCAPTCLREHRRQPRRTTAVDYTVNAASGIALATGPVGSSLAGEPRAPGVGHRHRPNAAIGAPRRGAATAPHRRGPAREDLARRRRVHDGRQPRLPRPGADRPTRTGRRSATTCTARSAATSPPRTAAG